MNFIEHITFNTGHTSRVKPGDVTGETLARLSPWLRAMIETGQAMPLPVSDFAKYTARASLSDGALLVSVSGPTVTSGVMAGKAPPLVSIGVAKRTRHTTLLWDLLKGATPTPPASNLKCPAAPWCGVVIHPSIAMHPDALQWLGDFERCIAWAWCSMDDVKG